jgi:hypothetical protein
LNKSNAALPILAAIFIVLMLVAGMVPVASAVVTKTPTKTSSSDPLLTVYSIPEDDQIRNKAVMWMAYLPVNFFDPTSHAVDPVLHTYPLFGATSPQIYYSEQYSTIKGTIAALDPSGTFLKTDPIIWEKKWSQFKLLVQVEGGLPGQNGYTGVPLATLVTAGKAVFQCHIYEKDKAEPKVPQDWSGLLSSLTYGHPAALSEEILKTILTDISSFFVCKLRPSGEAGIYVVDLYYIGPQTSEYVAENIVAFKVGLSPAAYGLKTGPWVWGLDIQDLCLLAWPLADPYQPSQSFGGVAPNPFGVPPDPQKWPHLIKKPEHKWLISFPDPMDGYAGCDELTLWQKQLLGNNIPIAPNDLPGP